MKRTYIIDVDGTIAHTEDKDYEKSIPIKKAVKKVNALFDAGHTILIWTGRGSLSGKDWRGLTARQLAEWGVKYHRLLMSKPPYDVWIDNCALNAKDWLDGKDEL